jgi:methylmalonyl-CoA mutase N-terminal domain/subunit
MDEIEQAAYDYAKSIDDGERVIVGLNKFTVDAEPEPTVFPIDPALERGQKERVRALRAARDAGEVSARLDELGGAVAAIEQGYQMDEIEQAAYEYTKSIDDGERAIIGVNRYADDVEVEPEILAISPELQRQQIERLRQFRADRDQDAVRVALEDLQAAARGTQNVLPPMRVALQRHATLGEVSDALREVFGVYHPGR